MSNTAIRDARHEDAPTIARIYNDAVVSSTAIWNDVTVDAANRVRWIDAHVDEGYPVLVVVDDGEVAGYATYGPFRPFDGYLYTVEHSVYVSSEHRGKGLGKALMVALIKQATEAGRHVMVAAIESSNEASIALHEGLGFVETGRMPQVGTKFGRWLDLVLMQRYLAPIVDGVEGIADTEGIEGAGEAHG